MFADADKRFLIKRLPPVLTLHLKRFEQRGMRATKNNRHVAFPCLLDMAPFCTQDSKVCEGVWWWCEDVSEGVRV